MLMMLIRTALWAVAVLAVLLAFDFLRDSSGGVVVDLNGRIYGPFAPLEFVGLVVALAALLWLGFKAFGFLVALVRFASGDETALSRFWNRARERRGFTAAAQGMIAMAEGDGRAAMSHARKAERLLDRPGLTQILVAQAAEASGDADTARRYYKKLASSPDTAYVGVRGLLTEALNKGDTERALKLAEHAFSLKPKSEEVLNSLFTLQSRAEDWSGARKTLSASVSARALTRDVGARREAVLLLAEARDRDDPQARRDLTLRANAKAPGLSPAAVDAARILIGEKSLRKARNILLTAWRHGPHPEIAAAFAAIQPDETPEARRKRFSDLLAISPDDPETRMLAAELALADRDWPGAREALGDLVDSRPSARALAIMAAVEKGDGASEQVIRGWLAKAVAAPRGPAWICDACGAQHGEWGPACAACDAFDTLDWRDTPAPDAAEVANAAMGPLVADETGGAVDASASEQEDEKDKPAQA